MAAVSSEARVLRVLCLHGSQQTKETFRARVGKLPHKARHVAELVFVDAPHELALRSGDAVPTRTWWRHSAGEEERSASARKSLDALEAVWREQGPFQGVLGFSMGGTVACALAARPDRFPGLRFVIAGGAPRARGFAALWGEPGLAQPLEVPSLHVFGEADKVVPAEDSAALAACFAGAQTFKHSQGHCLPTNAAGMKVYVDFLEARHAELVAPDAQEQEQQEGTPVAAPAAAPAVPVCASDESAQEQQDELEALASIFDGTLEVLQPAPAAAGEPCARLAVQLNTEGSILPGSTLRLRVQLPATYPEASPQVRLEHSLDVLQLPEHAERALVAAVEAELEHQLGMPSVFAAVSTAEAWLADEDNAVLLSRVKGASGGAAAAAVPAQAGAGAESDEDSDGQDDGKAIAVWEEEDEARETQMVEQATEEACANVAERLREDRDDQGRVALARGVRRFIVGLVGKPSAGKSTFFNCVTRLQNEAKVAAHPFTTIEPNFGTGWWVSDEAHDSASNAARFGRDAQGRRLLPLLVKDVAGLIPGAYKGQGKGNRFLNDLVDADVLVHVVDVSGSSDKNGVAVLEDDATASTAEQDIKWVREELHRWIFGNVSHKWRSVVRAARGSDRGAEQRTQELFSGYQGSRSTLQAAAFRAKLDLGQADKFSRHDLHRLVAHFLSVRFPMCLALNKADKLVERGVLERMEEAKAAAARQGYLAVACSARTETLLLGLAKRDALAYELGARGFELRDEAGVASALGKGADGAKQELEMAKRVIDTLGGTGVLGCISAAVRLRQPVLVYPVSDLKSCASIDPRGKQGREDRLRDCLQALPGTTVEDVFAALKRHAIEEYRLDGDFIRAEAQGLAPGAPLRQVGKDVVVDASTCVLKVMTNKKPVWQHKVASEQPV